MTDPRIVVTATSDFRRLNSDLKSTESRMGRMGKAARIGLGVGFGLASAAVVKFGVDSVKSLARIERLNAQTVAAIKSTGGAANVTAKDVDGLTHSLEDKTATEAESIQQGANFLLTFKNIRNEAGKNNKVFDQAVVALTDMSRATDKTGSAQIDMQKGALQLGKALNDPIKGMTALSRVGVSFTDQQAKTIKSLVESGDTMKAQKIILRELTDEFGGSGEAFAKTTTGKIAQAKDALGDFGETITKGLLPVIGDLAEKGGDALGELTEHADDIKRGFGEARDAVAPALDEIVEALGHLKDSIAGNGDVFHDKFLPALETTSEIVGGLVNFIDELPGPVKNLGVQVGIAAVAFNYLNGKVTLAKASLATYTTGAEAAAARSAKLQSGLRSLAGVGGMLLLAKSTQETNHNLGLLEGAAGGALAGFSVGGPWGAAIGAGAGALLALATQTEETGDTLTSARPKIQSMIDTLDQLTGATTAATRASALQNLQLKDGEGQFQSAIGYAQDLGISQRTLVDAALGHAGAVKRVNQAIKEQAHGQHDLVDADGNVIGSYKGLSANAKYLRRSLGLVNDQIKKDKREMRDAAQVTQDWSGKLKGFPKRARTKIDLDGVRPTETAIARLTLKYKNLDKKDIKTILGVTGVDATVKDIKRAADELKQTDKKEARTKVAIDGALKVRGEIQLTRDVLSNLNGDAAHTYIYTHHINTYENRGGPGRTAPDERLTPDVPAETVGRMIADVEALAPRAREAGKDVLSQLLAGITGGSDQVKSALDKLTAYLRKRINLKDDKAEKAREKSVLAHLKDEYAALVKVGKAQDAINRKLEKAREHLAEVRDWVEQVRTSFVDTGNVVQLGQLDDGTVSAPLLLDQLRDKVEKAKRFAQLIRDLSDGVGTDLNQQSLAQLLAAGPEAGLATAEALASGGDAALDEINNLSQQLADTGQQLGSQMSDQFFDVGLQASLGLVNGLESQNDALDKAARRIARRLAAEIRKALRSHSPSREMQDIGTDVIKGLTIGLDDTYVRTQGRKVALALIDGFANPKLGADATTAGAGGPFVVTVKLSADEESQLRRGKTLTLDINAGQGRGVRRRAVGGTR